MSVSNKTQVDWSNLPHDLLLHIADGLGLIELMNLCGVCKEWRNASLKLWPKKIEPLGSDPWFLIYDGGEGSKCSLLPSIGDKTSTARIPELDGATCLASQEGWLLVFRSGSAFFFCPFSMAKIDLPSFPLAEISGIAAAFSAPPTSQDCKVVVVRHSRGVEWELHLLSRGQDTWIKQNFHCSSNILYKIGVALFTEGKFQFVDNLEQGLVTFDAENRNFKPYRYCIMVRQPGSEQTSGDLRLKYWISRNKFGKNHFNKLGLDEDRVSISTCGTVYPLSNSKYEAAAAIPGESVGKGMEGENPHLLKGVWIMPRYHTPSMGQRW